LPKPHTALRAAAERQNIKCGNAGKLNAGIIYFQFSIKKITFAAKIKLKTKMDDGPAKPNANNNLLPVGMSSLP
jgi:hypothetical protein